MGAAPIGQGDYVECVLAHPCAVYGPVPLVVGRLYEVSDVVIDLSTITGWACGLVGVRSGGPNGRFGGRRFRPVYKRDASLTARLLSDIPADAPASPEEVVA